MRCFLLSRPKFNYKTKKMDLLRNLFEGFPTLWGGGVAHSVMILALVIAIGLALGKIKVAGVSLGLTWVLFAGLVFSYLGFNLSPHLLHFLKEFGLILFVYSIGMEVGPGFFSSLRKGGLKLNFLSAIVIALSIATAIVIHYATGIDMPTMAGLLTGAVTNTPGLGAAQQATSDLMGVDAPQIAMAYAVAYPVGVVGVVVSFIVLRFVLRIKRDKEEQAAKAGLDDSEGLSVRAFTVEIGNQLIFGDTIAQIKDVAKRHFVVSRLRRAGCEEEEAVHGRTKLSEGDRVMVIAQPKDMESITALLGRPVDMEWDECPGHLHTRKIIVTRQNVNGKTLHQLKLRTNFGTNITRVNRSGVELVASGDLKLQMGDLLTAVGSEVALIHTEKVVGNEMKRLNFPNLIPIFLGIALGCILANIPFGIPGIPASLKLGLTGGPLVVAIIIGYFGPKHNLVTYNTISANMMMRELGICIFLACVGLGSGCEFASTVFNANGLRWLGYGAIITILPILIGGLIGRLAMHLNFYTLLGVLSGCNTNPPALGYARDLTSTDAPSVGYSAVYPYAMFLRIVTIQILIIAFA